MLSLRKRRQVIPNAILALRDIPTRSTEMAGGKTTGRVRGPSKLRRPVVATHTETGKVQGFPSVSSAASAVGASGSAVTNVCHRAGRTVKGYSFLYKNPRPDDEINYKKSLERLALRKRGARKGKKARVVYSVDPDTRATRRYSSVALAARAVGCSAGSIRNALAHPVRRKAKGFFWYDGL